MASLSTNAVADKHLVSHPMRCFLYTLHCTKADIWCSRDTQRRMTRICHCWIETPLQPVPTMVPHMSATSWEEHAPNTSTVTRCSSVDINPFYNKIVWLSGSIVLGLHVPGWKNMPNLPLNLKFTEGDRRTENGLFDLCWRAHGDGARPLPSPMVTRDS